MMVTLICIAIITPAEVAFGQEFQEFEDLNGGQKSIFVLNRVFDIILFADVVFRFFWAYRDVDNDMRLVKEKKKIARRYIFKGWFFLDLVSFIPFDLLSAAFGSSTIGLLRLVRMLKVIKEINVSEISTRWQIDHEVFQSTLQLARVGFNIAIVVHWMACMWGLTAKLEGEEPYTWVKHLADSKSDENDFGNPMTR